MAVCVMQSVQKSNYLLLSTSQVMLTTAWSSNSKRFAQQSTATTSTNPLNKRPTQAVKPFSDMPGPKGLPYIGTLPEYIGPMKKKGYGFHKFFKVMKSRCEIYGSVYKENIGGRVFVVISDPVEYAKVVRADGKYPNRPEVDALKQYQLKYGMSYGVINSQNEEWHRHRSVLNKKMMRPVEILNYAERMSLVAGDMTAHIKTKRDQQTGVVTDIEQILFMWSLESVGVLVFDERLGCFEETPPAIAQDFIHSLIKLFKHMSALLFNPLFKIFPTYDWRQFEKHYSRTLDIGRGMIRNKIEKINQQENLDATTQEKKNSEFLSYLLVEKKLTIDHAISYAIDILGGGVETTANATLWLLYALSKNPKVQEELYEEISKVVKGSVTITAEMLANLPYLKACMKEQMRLFPLFTPLSRILLTETELGGYLVPAGTFIQGNIFAMGRDNHIFEDPLEYRPERWLRKDNEYENLMAMASQPFGHGPRMCIGRRLAEQEIYLAITKIVQTFKLDYAGSENVDIIQKSMLIPDRPVKIKFTPRIS